MNATSILLENLVLEAIDLHQQEKQLTLKSTLIVGRFEAERASARYGMSGAVFAEKIGLSPDQYWKRAQVARILRRFPETKLMVERGEASISGLALLSPKLTEANAEILLTGMKGKTKREIRDLLSVVTLDGRILEKEPTTELKITLTKSQTAKLDRAFEVLAACGHTPELSQVIEQAIDALLWRRDPLQKAQRAKVREEKKFSCRIKNETAEVSAPPPAPAQFENLPKKVTPEPTQEKSINVRRRVPNPVRHLIWRRDEGRCSWHYPDGERCVEKKMLEIDHITMVCRGGDNSAKNLTLRCRFHNQVHAEQLLGQVFMAEKRG